MIKDFEKFFIKKGISFHICIYYTELSTHADVRCRSWLRSQRDGCLLAKYLEMFLIVYFFIFNFLIVEDLVSAMKKKLEKEAMKQEIDE